MPFKIVVGYDGTEHARDALTLGERLATQTGATLVLANVYPGTPSALFGKGNVSGYFDILQRDAEQVLGEAPGGGDCERRAVGASSPPRGLNDLAEEIGAAMIVVGSAHHGKLGHVEAGHTGQQLLHGAPCAIAVAPVGYASTDTPSHGRVAVGFDGSPEAGVALQAATALARAVGAKLRVIAVAEPAASASPLYATPGEVDEAIRKSAEERMAAAVAAAPDDVTMEESMFRGDPAAILGDQPDCDLVVLGSRGYGHIKGVLLGSVSTKVVRGGNTPVIVVPRESAAPFAETDGQPAAPAFG